MAGKSCIKVIKAFASPASTSSTTSLSSWDLTLRWSLLLLVAPPAPCWHNKVNCSVSLSALMRVYGATATATAAAASIMSIKLCKSWNEISPLLKYRKSLYLQRPWSMDIHFPYPLPPPDHFIPHSTSVGCHLPLATCLSLRLITPFLPASNFPFDASLQPQHTSVAEKGLGVWGVEGGEVLPTAGVNMTNA